MDSLIGTLYLGFPLLATGDQPLTVDALLITASRGLIAFDLSLAADAGTGDASYWEQVSTRHFDVAIHIDSRLQRQPGLINRKKRDLRVRTEVVAYVPTGVKSLDENVKTVEQGKLSEFMETLPPVRASLAEHVQSAIEGVSRIRSAIRPVPLLTAGAKQKVLFEISQEVATLDQWQRDAAINCPKGPQRVRGIAGSGKTIVLAIKAAYLHGVDPNLRILVTYYTRALHQHIRKLIANFYAATAEREPDWDKIEVMHTWGSGERDGVYRRVCMDYGVGYLSLAEAMQQFGRNQAFEGACSEILKRVREEPRPLFDVILIDEAQDLPPSFLRLCYEILAEPKQLVWAYDELQDLTERDMPSLIELFGKNSDGVGRVQLTDSPNGSRQDIILPYCYRNSPWILASAHALGFGIYSDGGLVQYFDDDKLWTDIGYRVIEGTNEPGEEVVLDRDAENTPAFFGRLLSADESVQFNVVESALAQANAIAAEIQALLTTDGLRHEDILIVFPDGRRLEQNVREIIRELNNLEIRSHVAGVSSSVDILFKPRSIAIAGVFRAKGSEAPFVFVVNAEDCTGGGNLARKRNALFVAMTRGMNWLRVYGKGPGMKSLAAEFEKVKANEFRLRFKVPTPEQRSRMRRIQRDRSGGMQRVIDAKKKQLMSILQSFRRGDLFPEDLPDELREEFLRRLSDEPGPD